MLTTICGELSGASGYLILPLALLTAAFATTSADWVVGHSSLVQRVLMTAGLALIAVGLWSGARSGPIKMYRSVQQLTYALNDFFPSIQPEEIRHQVCIVRYRSNGFLGCEM